MPEDLLDDLRRDAAGGGDPNGSSQYASISADGVSVAFHSYATDLGPALGDKAPDVFVARLH